jgi:hypothetical protein
MANGAFNISKGRIAHYGTLPAASDGFLLVLFKVIQADDTLNNYDTLADIKAAANTECDFTNYARKTITSVTVTVDDTNNWVDVIIGNQVYAAAGGATNNTIVKAVLCYDSDTGTGTDANIVPMTYHDCSATTDGNELTLRFPVTGFFRAQ